MLYPGGWYPGLYYPPTGVTFELVLGDGLRAQIDVGAFVFQREWLTPGLVIEVSPFALASMLRTLEALPASLVGWVLPGTPTLQFGTVNVGVLTEGLRVLFLVGAGATLSSGGAGPKPGLKTVDSEGLDLTSMESEALKIGTLESNGLLVLTVESHDQGWRIVIGDSPVRTIEGSGRDEKTVEGEVPEKTVTYADMD